MKSDRNGFVLPLAAVGVALLSLALFSAATTLGDRSSELRRLDLRWRYSLVAANVEARLAHLVLTQPLSPRAIDVGVDENAATAPRRGLPRRSPKAPRLFLDGRPYSYAPPSGVRLVVSVQDEAGLLNLNNDDEASLGRLLTQAGVERSEAGRLSGALADFTDGDDLRRLNGAERADYAAAGLPPPRNAFLADAAEAQLTLGWSEALTPRRVATLLALTTAGEPERPVNPNTAPAEVLAALLRIDSKGVAALLEARELRTLGGAEDVAVTSGADLSDTRITFAALPARDLRLTITSAGSAPEVSFVYASRMSVADERSDRPLFWKRSVVLGGGTAERREIYGRMEELPDSPALLAARKR